jgi:hypothetical protein
VPSGWRWLWGLTGRPPALLRSSLRRRRVARDETDPGRYTARGSGGLTTRQAAIRQNAHVGREPPEALFHVERTEGRRAPRVLALPWGPRRAPALLSSSSGRDAWRGCAVVSIGRAVRNPEMSPRRGREAAGCRFTWRAEGRRALGAGDGLGGPKGTNSTPEFLRSRRAAGMRGGVDRARGGQSGNAPTWGTGNPPGAVSRGTSRRMPGPRGLAMALGADRAAAGTVHVARAEELAAVGNWRWLGGRRAEDPSAPRPSCPPVVDPSRGMRRTLWVLGAGAVD